MLRTTAWLKALVATGLFASIAERLGTLLALPATLLKQSLTQRSPSDFRSSHPCMLELSNLEKIRGSPRVNDVTTACDRLISMQTIANRIQHDSKISAALC